MAKHSCALNLLEIFGCQLKPHRGCHTDVDEDVTTHAIHWHERVCCLVQVGGPCTIFDFRTSPGQSIFYETIEEAVEPLKKILSEL
jgi:hypothetical protein